MPELCDSGSDERLLTLGHAFISHSGAAYEQAVTTGQVVLHNTLPESLERISIGIEPVSHCCVLSSSCEYIARLEPEESQTIDFRLASLERSVRARFSVEYVTTSHPVRRGLERLITVEPEVLVTHRERKIFVSYARPDYHRIRPLLAAVRTCGSVWIDRSQLPRFEWFARSIRSAIRCANVFLIFLSNDSIRSPWVKDEINLACNERLPIVSATLEACAVPEALMGSALVAVHSTPGSEILVETLRRAFKALEKG